MITINFKSSKDNDEEDVMHSKNDNIEIMINDKADKVIEELFQSLLYKYQTGLEISRRGSDKKATINPINEKIKFFQYAVTVALNYKEMKNIPQRITKIKPFINNYNWDGISYPSEKYEWKKFEKINVTIPLNVFHAKKKKYISCLCQNITQIVKNKSFF